MSEVKRYHVTEAGLVEGSALGRLNVVLGADHDRVTAERDALQALLTAADERADVLETENKRLDLMVSQADYNYDADRMQFKARIDVLEGLLISWLKDFGRTHSGLQRLKERTQAALKPAAPATDEHVCTGCGAKGWTANCKECVPY